MNIHIFNKEIKITRDAARILALYALAAAVMAGNFFYSAATPKTRLTVVRANGVEGVNSGGGDFTLANNSDGAYGAENGRPESEASAGGANMHGGPGVADGPAVEPNFGDGALASRTDTATFSGGNGAISAVDAGRGGGAAVPRDGFDGFELTPRANENIDDKDKIYIYITGAVKKPGVYTMARSSMIVDAVEIAGGFTEYADAENVNMVYRLESNAMLNIKRKPATGLSNNGAGQSVLIEQAANTSASELYGGAVEIGYGYDGVLLTGDNSDAGESESQANGDGARRVNINSASQKELETLPGIGKATAEKIIEHRIRQKFARIEDLMKVNGIKQAKFDAVKDFISCQ